jgi:hypothetical protein
MKEDEKKRLQEQCEDWVTKSNFKLKNNSNATAFSDLSVFHASGIEIHVVQPNADNDEIYLMQRTDLAPDAQAAAASLSADQRNNLIGEAINILLIKGVQFKFDFDSSTIKSILLQRTLYGEGLSKQVFFDALMLIVEAQMIASRIILAKLGQSLASATNTSGDASRTLPYT